MMPSTVSRTARPLPVFDREVVAYQPNENVRPMSSERWDRCRFLIGTHRIGDEGGPVSRFKVDQYVAAMQDMADEIARLRRQDGP